VKNTIRDTLLSSSPITASAPCRIDMGGTLDLSTFYLPLRALRPCTFNIALNMRTTVRIETWNEGTTRISSRGFESAEFSLDRAPFDHPLGFMFAVANYFEADGVHIVIESSSPPRSALGGSSAAAVALIKAFTEALKRSGRKSMNRRNIALLAHALEASVAGVPCGMQDHLAAAYGGVNAWYWPQNMASPVFKREPVVTPGAYRDFARHILVAYCGIPHVSADINGQWVRQFVTGEDRPLWFKVAEYTHGFVEALSRLDYAMAADYLNREVALRLEMTPNVLDDIGKKLVASAIASECGARFTGAGAGGCVWALGGAENIDRVKEMWEKVLSTRADARLLEATIDRKGLGLDM